MFPLGTQSDYMAAIEDAIILNCDSVNLSLGSSNAGMTTNSTYQSLLDYVTGARASISSADFADINHDGRVDTYDVHLFLGKLGKDTVSVPATGSVKLTVTMTLTEEQ